MMLFYDNNVPFFFTSTKSNATAEYFVIAKTPHDQLMIIDSKYGYMYIVSSKGVMFVDHDHCSYGKKWRNLNAEHWLFIYSLKLIKYFHSCILDYKKRFISAARKCKTPVSYR